MRRLLFLFLGVAWLFPCVAWGQGFNYSCDFEEVTERAAWHLVNGSSVNHWQVGDFVGDDGNGCLFVTYGAANENKYDVSEEAKVFAYRELHLLAGRYEFSYNWRGKGEGRYDYLRFVLAPASVSLQAGISAITESTLPVGWYALDGGFRLSDGYNWGDKSGEVVIEAEGDYKLIAYWRNDGSGGTQPAGAIDNIVLNMPACQQPLHVRVHDVSTTGATVEWYDVGEADTWMVECMPMGSATAGMVSRTVSDSICVLDGLESGTQYKVTVKGNCGETMSDGGEVTFRTSCGALSLPYYEGFDDVEEYACDPCWFDLGGECQARSSSYSIVIIDGLKSMTLSDGGVLASPYVPLAGNEIALDFSMMKDGSKAGALVVGFSSSIDDLTQMIGVDTLMFNDELVHDIELDFSNIGTSEMGYIIFKQINNEAQYQDYYIDRVYVREIASCKRPAAMSVKHVTHHSAQLSWTAVEGATQYSVVYGLINDPDTNGNMMLDYTTNTEVVLSDLESDTTYYVWVRNLCGSNYSEWRSGGSFKTQVACAKVLNVEVSAKSTSGIALEWDFDEAVGGAATEVVLTWSAVEGSDVVYDTAQTTDDYYIIQGLEASTTYNIGLRTVCTDDTSEVVRITASTAFSGVEIGEGATKNRNVPTHCFYKHSYAQMLYPADEVAGLDTIRSFAFHVECTREAQRIWDVYMGNVNRTVLSPGAYIRPDHLTKVGDSILFDVATGWCTVRLTTPFVHEADSGLVIVVDDNTGAYVNGVDFYVHSGEGIYYHVDGVNISHNDASAMNRLASAGVVPNIMFATPFDATACSAPLLVVGEVTGTSVELVWDGGREDDTWQVEYKLPSETEWTLYQTGMTDTSVVVSGLLAGRTYELRVGTQCGETILYAEKEVFTHCAAVETPFMEDFTATTLSPCWTFGNKSGYSAPTRSSTGALSMGYFDGGYAVMPEFIDELSSLHILFKMKSEQEHAKVIVAVGSDPMDIESFETIDTLRIIPANTYVPLECSFEEYVGEGHYIALISGSGQNMIDDIVVEYLPLCSYPTNLVVSNITENGATINWSGSNGYTMHWMVTYGVVGSSYVDTVDIPAQEYSYVLSGLLPNTHYEVGVHNVCAQDTMSAMPAVAFRTPCGVVTLPYNEDFEGSEADVYHPCWYSTNAHSYGYGEMAPVVYDMILEDRRVLKFGDNVDMITCLIPTEGNRILLSFDAMIEDEMYGGKLAVGFTTSTDDLSGAIYVDTITFENTDWNHYDISFGTMSSTEQGYVVLKNFDNQSYYDYEIDYDIYPAGFIDNLTIAENNGCSGVTQIAVEQVGPTTATITFEDEQMTGSYTVGYSTTNSIATIGDYVETTTLSCTLLNLQPNTTYYVWVRTNCAMGMSGWEIGPMFRTPCAAVSTLPYEEDFDSYLSGFSHSLNPPFSYPNHTMPDCWTILNMSDREEDYPQAFMSRSASYGFADSATCLLFVSSSQTPIYAVLPAIETHVSDLKISFKYCNESMIEANGEITLGVMTDGNDAGTFIPITVYPRQDALTAVTHNFALDNLQLDEQYRIAFRYGGGSRSNMVASLDNIVVDMADDCFAPEHYSVSSVGMTTATLVWDDSHSGSYKVQYRVSTSGNWDEVTVVGDTTVTLTDLQNNTLYVARVQADCGSSVSMWTNEMSFMTQCGIADVPFIEDFDSYSGSADIASGTSAPRNYPNHTMPTCWNFPVMNMSTPKVFLNTNSNYAESGNCLFFVSSSSTTAYAILPMMNEPINTLNLKLTYRNESMSPYNPKLKIGVMTNPADVNSFIELDSLAVTDVAREVIHYFAYDTELDAQTDYYIALAYGGDKGNNFYLGVDNVEVNLQTACITPSALMVSNVTDYSASVSWMGLANEYEVAYRVAGVEQWTIQPVVGTSATITGLAHSTDYQLRVRAICEVGDSSAWSSMAAFTTGCAPYEMPFYEDFARGLNNADIPCWERYRGLMSEIMAGTAQFTEGSKWRYDAERPIGDNERNAHLDIWSNNTDSWLISPRVVISSVANLEFDMARYDFNNNAVWQQDDKFVVLISTDNGGSWSSLRSWSGTDFPNIPVINESSLHVAIDLSTYVNDTVQVAFYGESTVSGGDHYIYIDNVIIDAPSTSSCEAPTQLTASDITPTEANLSWQGVATNYEVAYRIHGTNQWNTQSVNVNHCTLMGLQITTQYDWRVRSVCGLNDFSEWSEANFSTLAPQYDCDAPSHLMVNEISTTTATLTWQGEANYYEVNYRALGDEGWISQQTTATQYRLSGLHGNTTYQWRVRAYCSDTDYSQWVNSTFRTANPSSECETPTALVAVANGNTVTVDWNDNNDPLAWEVSLLAMDGEEQIVTAEVHPTTIEGLRGSMSYTVKVRAMCGETNYSDWSEAIGFSTATCVPVVEVAVSEITDHSAKISWTAGGDELEWDVEYGVAGFELGTGETATIGNNLYQLSELNANTDYEVYVRALCGENFYSEWSERVAFKTTDGHEGIDGVGADYRFEIYPNPTHDATTISLQGVAGKVMVSVVDMNGRRVMQEVMECDGNCEKRVTVLGLAQGTYFVRVVGDAVNSVRKLIVR